jgi:hypothetical protein
MAPHGPAPPAAVTRPGAGQKWAAKRPGAAKQPSKAAVIPDVEALIALGAAQPARLRGGGGGRAAPRAGGGGVRRRPTAQRRPHRWRPAALRRLEGPGPLRWPARQARHPVGRTICPWPASTTDARRRRCTWRAPGQTPAGPARRARSSYMVWSGERGGARRGGHANARRRLGTLVGGDRTCGQEAPANTLGPFAARAAKMQRASPGRDGRACSRLRQDYGTIALKLSVRSTLSVISAP